MGEQAENPKKPAEDQEKSKSQDMARPLYVAFKKDADTGVAHAIDFDFDQEQLTFEKRKRLSAKENESVSESNLFEEAIKYFIRDMNAYLQGANIIALMLPAFSPIAISTTTYRVSQKHGKKIDNPEFEVYEMPHDKIEAFNGAMQSMNQWYSFLGFLPRMALIGIVSSYDGYLTNLLTAYFKKNPQAINESEKKISAAEVLAFSNLDEFKERMIQKEVENVIRDSHANQFKWLEEKLEIPLRKGLTTWESFLEICERRNLFTHSNGVVSQLYLDNCKKLGYKFKSKLELGEKLAVNKAYLKQAAEVVFEVGVKLGHVVWRKNSEKGDVEAERSYSNIAFEMIKSKNYLLANRLLEFGVNMPKLSETWKRIMTVNYANSKKLSGDKKAAMEILEGLDWSATALEYKVCVAAIKEEMDDVVQLMKLIGSNGSVSKMDYVTWPVFIEARKDEKFRLAYTEIFGGDLESDEVSNEFGSESPESEGFTN